MKFQTEIEAYQKLVETFSKREAVVFCGAGISLEPPAGLPDWHKLRDYTLEAIAGKDSFLGEFLGCLTEIDMIAAPGKKGLTPEYVASAINDHSSGYFECFRVLEQGNPNANHLYLAKMAKLGYLKHIVTCNFDIFLEQALIDENVPHKVYRTDEDFSDFQKDSSVVQILKIHGCIEAPSSITATVEQEGRGLSDHKKRALEELMRDYRFVFWGYSGADLKMNLDYLHMVRMRQEAKGFIWNFLEQDDWKEPVNPHVLKLAELYESKSYIVHGKLPDTFDFLLDTEDQIKRERYSLEQEKELSELKNQKLQKALFVWAEENLRPEEALSIFGRLLKYSGQILEAAKCYEKILKSTDDSKNYQILANAYNELGYIAKIHSEYEKAIEHFQEAEKIARRYEDKGHLALYLNSLAGIYRIWRKYGKALKLYQQAEKIARGIDDQSGLAMYLNKLAGIHKSMGEWEKALEYLEKAEALTRKLGDQQGLAINLDNMGKIYRDSKRDKQALKYFKEAERITRSLGDKQGLAVRFGSLASIYKRNSQTYGKALYYYKEAEKIASELGDKIGILLHSRNIANIYRLKKDFSQSIACYQKTLAMAEELDDFKAIARTSKNIADLYRYNLKQIQDSVSYYQKSLEYYEKLRWKKEISIVKKELESMDH